MSDKYKVLIVDDNEINAMLAAELVAAFNLEGVVAASGEEAVEMARDNEYSFILMDHIMTGMDGVKATEIIHASSDVPIYAMTGDLNAKIAAEFSEAGAVSALSKPLKAKEIAKVIEACVPEGGYTLPEDMAAGNTDRDKNTEAEGSAITLSQFLGTVSGLDFSKGIANSLGNENSYLKLLKATSGNIREYVKVLSEYIETADPTQLKLASHSLKTVFANIGMENLRSESERVEVRASELLADAELAGSIPSFDAEHQEIVTEYISHTMNAALELEDAIAGYEQAALGIGRQVDYSIIERPLDEKEIAEVIEYTETAINRFEIDYILEGLEILKRASMGDERKKIEAAIDAANEFMYEKVNSLFEEVVSLKKGRGEAR